MASVEETVVQGHKADGAKPAKELVVENPATGQVVATLQTLRPEQVAELAARGRAVQPAWEALGFEGRGRVLRRAQKWVVDHGEEIVETIVAETGKAYEDAELVEV